MVRGLYTAAAGMLVQQQKVDVLANNMANADTVGFKRETTVVEEFGPSIWANLKDLTEKKPRGSVERELGPAGTGVISVWSPVDFTQGAFQLTQSATDLMIEGQAFFAIRAEDQDEIFYTRSGSFVVDQEGFLLTVDSSMGRRYHVLDDQQQYMRVNEWDSFVDIYGVFNGTGQRIGIVSFGDLQEEVSSGEQSLLKVGHNRFSINPNAVGEVTPQWLNAAQMGAISVVQGGLEASNVNVIREMVQLIAATRAYEANQKVIQMTDQTLGQANEIGRV